MYKILILGSGSREHILANSYLKGDVGKVYISPGNKYISDDNIECVKLEYDDLQEFIRMNDIKLVSIGSEKYLVDGVVDFLEGTLCFGPNKRNSQLEGSKEYSKKIMEKYNLPTAQYKIFNNYETSYEYIRCNFNYQVIKYSGLAGGKGVFLPNNLKEAKDILEDIFINKRFNCYDENNIIVLEDRLYGEEVSLMGFCNGKEINFMPQSQDYKKYYNDDKGPNTGGMGSICPVNILNNEQINELKIKINKMVKDLEYKGVLYIGLIVSDNGYNILEFNCRFGDPEAQVLLTLLKTDLYKISIDCILGNKLEIEWDKGYATNVVLSHHNYPYKRLPELDIKINGKKDYNNFIHKDIKLYWGGSGRLLSMTGYNSKSLYKSTQLVMNNIHKIEYEGKYYRTDIGTNVVIKPDKIINRKMKIGILGSTRGTSSELLLKMIKNKEINAEVSVIITNKKKSGLIEKARDYGISLIYLPLKKGITREEYDRKVVNMLKLYDVDIVFLIGYMRIITSVLINQFRNRIFNIHPSLLPKYAGGMDLNVHEEVLKNKEIYSGCTLHQVTEVVDGGLIMFQEQCNIQENDTKEKLKEKIQKLEKKCIINCVKICINGQYNIWSSYKDSGVNVENGNKLVNKIKDMKEKKENIGKFCSIIKIFNNSEHRIGLCTDGVGTKLELANKYNKLDGIGIDLVAMSVNDLIVHGIKPCKFLDYIAVDKLDIDKHFRIIQSINKGCEIANCELVGGETAEMNSIYYSGGFDLAGFALGACSKLSILPNNIEKGNIIYGLKSSGIHSNGYTLVNKLLKYNYYNIDEILKPTKIYMEIFNIIDNYNEFINGLIHITGGGFKDNINRIIPKNLNYKLKDWEFPDIFKWIQKYSLLSKNEMLNTFNCGFGMLIIANQNYTYLNEIKKKYEIIELGYIY